MQTTLEMRPGKLTYVVFILTPLLVCYLFPYLFYQQPISVLILPIKHLQNYTLPLRDIYQALFIALTWIALVILAIFIPSRKKFAKSYTWSHTTSFTFMLISLLLGCLATVIFRLINLPMMVSQLMLPLTLLPVASIILSFHLLKSPKQQKTKSFYFITAILINLMVLIYFPLSQGTAGPILYSLIGINFGIIALKYPKNVVITSLLISILIVATVMILKNEVRLNINHNKKNEMQLYHRITDRKNLTGTSPLNSINLINMDLTISAHYSPNFKKLRSPITNTYSKYILNRILNRINHLGELAYTVETTPKKIPFLRGETYRMLPYLFIPRLIWPNKPIDDNGWLYGHRYTFISNPDDSGTAWALPMPTEAWINFGWPGIIISALMIGFVLRIIWLFFIGRQPSIGNIIIGAVVVLSAAGGEADTNMAIGNALHCLLAYWILIKAVIYTERYFSAKDRFSSIKQVLSKSPVQST